MPTSLFVTGASAALGLLLAAAAQLVAPLHVPGHEATQVFAAVGGLLLLLVAGGPDPVEPVAHWGRSMLGAIGLGGGFAAGMAIATAGYGCDPSGTQTFLWVTWLPLAAFFASLATVVRARWPVRVGLFIGLAIACLVHDGLQQLFAARTVDPLIGLPLFLDQRADLALPSIHLYGRIWLLSVALAMIAVRVGIERHPVRPLAVASNVVALGLTLCGSRVGLGLGDAALHDSLDAVHSTAHYDLRYRTGGDAAARIETIAREAEWLHHQLETAWGTRVDTRFQVLVFDGMTHLEETTGMGNAHATWRSLAMPWWDGLDGTFTHELVHLFHQDVAWDLRLVVLPGFVEGTAMAFDDHRYAFDPDAHAEIAAVAANGDLVSPSVFLHPLGFVTVEESNAYRLSGSFMGFLVLEHGVERFLELQRTLDFEGTYGRDLATLETDWRAFLAEVPFTKDDQARSRDRYDPTRNPGLLGRTCPKLGPAEPGPGDEAATFARFGAWNAALERYRALADAEPEEARWQWGTVYALQELGRHDEALARIPALPADHEDQVLRRLNTEIRSLLALERWEALYTAFATRRTLEDADQERQTLEELLHDPEVRGALGPILLRGRSAPLRAGDELEALAGADPERAEAWAVLTASRGGPIPSRRNGVHEDLEGWERWLDAVEQAGVCEERLERAVLVALDQDDCTMAARVLRTTRSVCASDLADRLRERWDWHGCRL